MSTKERASIAGRARQASQSPEERRDAMRKVRMAGHVNAIARAVAEAAPELSADQVAKLRAVFAAGESA